MKMISTLVTHPVAPSPFKGEGWDGGKLLFIILLLTALPAQSQPLNQARALITPSQQATLSASLTDEIKEIRVKESESFQQGDTLITFNCDTTQAQLKKAEAELEIHQRTLLTQQKMQQMQSVSNLEVDITRARTQQAEAELETIQTEARRCTITAPFDGRVTERHAHPFESVKRGAKLIDIINHKALTVELHIPSNWLRWLRVGTPFTLTLDETGSTVEATVSTIGAQINPVSQTLKIKGTLNREQPDKEPPELLSGMSGTARFSSGQ